MTFFHILRYRDWEVIFRVSIVQVTIIDVHPYFSVRVTGTMLASHCGSCSSRSYILKLFFWTSLDLVRRD